MNYQWYPGHMTKAVRAMKEQLKLIDLVIEIIDARIPVSSRNPDLNEMAKGKYMLVVLNKSDLADPGKTAAVKKKLNDEGRIVLETDARNKASVKNVKNAALSACAEKIERDRKRGIVGRPIRAMVVGIPNVGKSTFINSIVGRSSAKTGNKPGVTKGNQWISTGAGLELLDTPGILWPKFEDQTVGRNIALIGSMNDEITEPAELALELADILKTAYPDLLKERYFKGEEDVSQMAPAEIMNSIAVSRGCIVAGGETDIVKASRLFIDDFRSGRLGRISLE